MTYVTDRQFTDYVHNTLALSIIYPKLDWKVQNVNNRLSNTIDVNNAVDYMVVDKNRKLITVQERFREKKYASFSDFTLRYMRPDNKNPERLLSEFFKLNADYMIYGIIDVSKTNVNNAKKFLKYAVIDLNVLLNLIDKKLVVIDSNLKGFRCVRMNNIMYCPINSNYDKSSTFVPFDIVILSSIAPDVIIIQEGFF